MLLSASPPMSGSGSGSGSGGRGEERGQDPQDVFVAVSEGGMKDARDVMALKTMP